MVRANLYYNQMINVVPASESSSYLADAIDIIRLRLKIQRRS